MFVILLGGTLVFSAGLLATASWSDGALVAVRTAAQVMGWLFVASVVIAWTLRRGNAGEFGAAAVTFSCGILLLYTSYFQWGQAARDPIGHVIAADVHWQADFKLIDYSRPAPTLISATVPAKAAPLAKEAVAAFVANPVPAPRDACASLNGVEALQCRRCADKSGLRLVVCHETARLEYCADRPSDEGICPSAIPYSPPG